ncbi:hypothetical protein K2X33_05090 [bacterium]|nr:hypothetical protein [bacterium]
MQNADGRLLVNPLSVQKSFVKLGDVSAHVLDISYIRAVVEAEGPFHDLAEGQTLAVQFELDRSRFSVEVTVRGRGPGWVRLDFPKLVPSVRAHLRSFLSPRKIGESIVEDWRSGALKHFHGLNESELWTDGADGVLFTYLDQDDPQSQFLIRVREARGPLCVGKVLRRDYMELSSIDAELQLLPLTDSEVYRKLGECRDIVTNFRPSVPAEYTLKQKMLKTLSEHLYSTSRRVEMLPNRPAAQPAPRV